MADKIKTISIHAGYSDKAKQLTKKLTSIFRASGFKVSSKNPDLIITVGGDGALIKALREMNYPEAPFFGINAGTVGFMQELELKDVKSFIRELKAGTYKILEVPLLAAHSKGKGQAHTHGFNEIVIERVGSQAAHLDVYINGRRFESFKGDGLIFTTPQGSTAYGLAAGGAVFPFSVNAFQLVPSNPWDTVNNRTIKSPMLLPDTAKVRIVVEDYKHRKVQVISDGAKAEVGLVKEIEISVSSHKLRILRTHRFNFYQRMSEKLIGNG